MLQSYAVTDFAPKTKSLRATCIPSTLDLKAVFTRGYDAACGVSFALWVTGLLCAWCLFIWGCRSNVDMDSLKMSHIHDKNTSHGWASTAYEGGRNKLAGNKKGMRPWNAFFVCLETRVLVIFT